MRGGAIVVLVLAFVAGALSAPYTCGAYGPTEAVLDGPGNMFTAKFSSPGLLFDNSGTDFQMNFLTRDTPAPTSFPGAPCEVGAEGIRRNDAGIYLFGCTPDVWTFEISGIDGEDRYIFGSGTYQYAGGFATPRNFPPFDQRVTSGEVRLGQKVPWVAQSLDTQDTNSPERGYLIDWTNTTIRYDVEYNDNGLVHEANLHCDLKVGEMEKWEFEYDDENRLMMYQMHRPDQCWRASTDRLERVVNYGYHKDDVRLADPRRTDYWAPTRITEETKGSCPSKVQTTLTYNWEFWIPSVPTDDKIIPSRFPNDLHITMHRQPTWGSTENPVSKDTFVLHSHWFDRWGKIFHSKFGYRTSVNGEDDPVLTADPNVYSVEEIYDYDLNNRNKEFKGFTTGSSTQEDILEMKYVPHNLKGILKEATVKNIDSSLNRTIVRDNLTILPDGEGLPIIDTAFSKNPQFEVENVCRGTWVVRNIHPDYTYSVEFGARRNENADSSVDDFKENNSAELAPGQHHLITGYGGKPMEFFAVNRDPTNRLTRGPSTSKNCIELVPICDGTYEVINGINWDVNFSYIASVDDLTVQGSGMVPAGGSTRFSTSQNGRQEVVQLFLNGMSGGISRQARRRGADKPCPPP